MAETRRSGHEVRDTTLTAGLLSSLLAPFISMGVRQLELVGVPVGEGYEDQLLAAVIVVISYAAAEWRMRRRVAQDAGANDA